MTDHRFSQCWKLFSTFFRIGAFTFGGGYAMIPLIHREAVEANHWVDDQEILDIIAIAESTPGPIAINSATFIGYKVGGLAGSAAATLGVVLPSFLVISIISLFFAAFVENRWVAWAFEGIRPAVVILILGAVVKMKKSCPNDLFHLLILGLVFVLAATGLVSTIPLLVSTALCGILRQLFLARKGKAGDPS